ncbi:MAG: hydrogenase nickel incorporation protein HypB [Ardenticatenales bacterium]|nr:hydrogenase nickel incorporation protein HypB [Ardenticatenales bacterium]
MTRTVPVVEQILSANDRIALQNRSEFDAAGLFAINLMASPGAGKTSLIMETVKALKDEFRLAAVDGDVATSIDSDKVAALGVPAVQINTGGACHLDAAMLQAALPELSLPELDLLVVENVGNLICPTGFRLGVHRSVLIASVPEGDDKPYKYPGMYQGVDAMLLNKMDVLSAFDFDMDYFRRGVEILNPGLTFFAVSCKTGEGLDAWLNWVRAEVAAFKGAAAGYEIR